MCTREPFSLGRHIFKVSLGKVWRRIAISGEATLSQFGDLIRDSVKFDDDHLDQFTYENSMGRQVNIMHPYMNEGEQFTDEIMVGSLPLVEGDKLKYLFDFGDCWEFEACLETVEPEPTQGIPKVKSSKRSKKNNKPRAIGEILESHGEAPEQYPESDW
ncbi:MAG: hypothetical protein AAGC93_15880 [Cyanobacteria bacterium P01_F01_bin.53]